MTTTTESRPFSVTLAAVCVGLLALRQLATNTGPALLAGHPSALQELLSVALMAYVPWGIFAIQRWAWWLGVIISVVGGVISLGVLGSFEKFQSHVALADPDAFSRSLIFVGAVSIAAFVLLTTPSSRAAFRNQY